MALPRILWVVPLLVAGMYLPTASAAPTRPPAAAVGMAHEAFARKTVVLGCGQTLTMANNSHWVHIIGPGRNGTLEPAQGVPVVRRELMQTNDVRTTGAWSTPGTYYLTCSVHPEMNLKVIVTGCKAPASG